MAKNNNVYENYTLTAPVLMAFPNLITPKQVAGKGDPKFSANFVIAADHPDLAAIKSVVTRIAATRWPGRPVAEIQIPLKSGTVMADKRLKQLQDKARADGKDPAAVVSDGEYQRGKVVVTATSGEDRPPSLSVILNGKIVDLEDPALKVQHKDKFFFGAEVLAQINFATYDGNGSTIPDGITAYLSMVLSTGKGERIGGGQKPASEVFKGYAGSYSAEDPLALGV